VSARGQCRPGPSGGLGCPLIPILKLPVVSRRRQSPPRNKHVADALGVVEDLVEQSEVAIGREVSAGCVGVKGAVHGNVFNGLDW
jgi:hypothetical protein